MQNPFLTLLLAATLVSAASLPPTPQPSSPKEPTPRPLRQEHLKITVPPAVRQGEVLQVQVRNAETPPLTATLANREAHFFQQRDGSYLALVSVSVFESPKMAMLNIQDAQGELLDSESIMIQDAHYRIQNVQVSKATEGLKPLPGELEAIQTLKDMVSPARYWSEPFLSPTPDCQNSPFGVLRYHNGKPTGDYHKGVDLRSPMGRPIRAITGGRVQIARMFRLHGGTVGLDHGQGVSSIYIHMSKVAVKAGQLVSQGETIGYVGSTGFATGPHLHWGLYVSGLPVNPSQFIHVPKCQ